MKKKKGVNGIENPAMLRETCEEKKLHNAINAVVVDYAWLVIELSIKLIAHGFQILS